MHIKLNGRAVEYTLERKSVKNINVRIKRDGKIYVSANGRVPLAVIEGFLQSKADYILRALEKVENSSAVISDRIYSEEQLFEVINTACRRLYAHFEKRGVLYPKIKLRRMRSRWGSCNSARGVVTFSKYLAYAPQECIEYVVMHEFTHFLVQNHSARFYTELAKVCPDWKEKRKLLNEIRIPG